MKNQQIRIENGFVLKKSLLKVVPSSWDKINIDNYWVGEISKAFRASQLLMNGDNFPSQESYDDFKRFVDNDLKLKTNRGILSIRDINYKEKIQEGEHPIYFKEDVENALLEMLMLMIRIIWGSWFNYFLRYNKKSIICSLSSSA